jgi:hypothetical protein
LKFFLLAPLGWSNAAKRAPPSSMLRGAIPLPWQPPFHGCGRHTTAGWLADLAGWPTGGRPPAATSVKPPINKRMGGPHFQSEIRLSIAPACETAPAQPAPASRTRLPTAASVGTGHVGAIAASSSRAQTPVVAGAGSWAMLGAVQDLGRRHIIRPGRRPAHAAV